MGTTKTSITGGDNPVLAFVLAIEGYANLITSWSDTGAVTTAWAGSGYSAAIRGLDRPGKIPQEIEPFRPRINGNQTTFVIKPDENETLAVDVFATEKSTGNVTALDADLTPSNSAVTVKDASDFASAPGSAYIGTERFTYGGKTGTSFTGCSRGTPVPFPIDGGSTFGRHHAQTEPYGVTVGRPRVTDYPRSWVGKWVGCWAHRVVDGVLDTKANAELIFAGTISDIAENHMAMTMTCTDAVDYVGSQVLLGDQWSAQPEEGLYLDTGDVIKVAYTVLESGGQTYSSPGSSNTFTVGTDIAAGITIAEDLIDAFNDWSKSNWTLGSALDPAPDHNVDWVQLVGDPDGAPRYSLNVLVRTTGSTIQAAWEITASRSCAALLGLDLEVESVVDEGKNLKYRFESVQTGASTYTDTWWFPFNLAYAPLVPSKGQAWTLQAANGTWIDQGAYVPQPWKSRYGTTSENWGFVRYDRFTYIVKYASNTSVTPHWDEIVEQLDPQKNAFKKAWTEGFSSDHTYPRNDAYIRKGRTIPRLKQIILLHEPKMSDWLIKTFASTGVSGYNESSYDKYNRQLGLAVPYSLLGATFENTAKSFADPDDFLLFLDRPTKFEEVLVSELSLRNTFLVFNGGALRFVSLNVDATSNATHTLTVSNKAAHPDRAAEDFPDWGISRSTIINQIKVNYDRTLDEGYRSKIEVVNEQSKTDHGQGQPLTIDARNSVSLREGSADSSARDLVVNLASGILRFYSEPHPVMMRSLMATNWFASPGDTAVVTDNFVRSVATGARGVTTYPGWIKSVAQDWQTMRGEVTVILHGESNNRVTYSPAMKVATHSSGTITVDSNEFTLAAEGEDGDHFDENDVVDIVEASPSTPGSPQKWERTIDTKNSSTSFVLSGALTGIDLVNKDYYVYSAAYGSAQSTQQSHCYIGDDVDGQIVDTIDNRIWSRQGDETLTFAAANTTDRIEFVPTDGQWTTEGEAVHPPMHRNAVVIANQLINRRTAHQLPIMMDGAGFVLDAGATNDTYYMAMFPYPYDPGQAVSTGYRRKLYVGPALKSANAGNTVTLRVTSSAWRPTSTTAIDDTMSGLAFPGPSTSQTWTTTSTTYENVAEGALELVQVGPDWLTWITVEIKGSAAATYDSTFYGFHTWWVGPLE